MKKFTAYLKIFSAVVLTLLFCGCGYTIGYLNHPQLKSVAVAPVVNNTTSYNAAAQMRNLLCEAFMSDGSMKLEGLQEADCIVYAKITKVSYSEVGWSSNDDDNFQPNEWRCSVNATFSVILPGRAKPLISNASVSGSAEFVSGPDIENSRINGLRQAMYDASQKIVSRLTEAW